jgi:hypothetical protein
VILDFFKYPEEVNNKVYAVDGKPNADKAGKGELIVAYLVTQLPLEARNRAWRSWKFVVPRYTGR